MSLWSKCKMIIKDVKAFEQACQKNDISFKVVDQVHGLVQQGMKVYAVIKDKQASVARHNEAYLCARTDGKGYQLVIDNDPNWCSITARMGPNGGNLTRSYTEALLRKSIMQSGGMVQSVKEQTDRWLVMRVAVP